MTATETQIAPRHETARDMPSVLQPLAVKTHPGKIYLHECCSIQKALAVIQPLHTKSGSGSFCACTKQGCLGPDDQLLCLELGRLATRPPRGLRDQLLAH